MSARTPSREDWARQQLRVVRALLGFVSPNFRRVGLAHDGHSWRVKFVLEHDDPSDAEAIEDFAGEFDALQEGPLDWELDVEVAEGPLLWPEPPETVLYCRREENR